MKIPLAEAVARFRRLPEGSPERDAMAAAILMATRGSHPGPNGILLRQDGTASPIVPGVPMIDAPSVEVTVEVPG